MNYLTSVGLETHVQLRTNSKIWCGCANAVGHAPNTDVCPVCLGYPGALPVLNQEAVRLTMLTGMMLGCEINLTSKHDRKSYFYPDMPKNYQITQYDQPFCGMGGIEIEVEGKKKLIRITRIHLEEDVGKSIHGEAASQIDFNRAGTPLMEIVTEPDIAHADEAFAYLVALKQILEYGEVSDCNLEEGNIRCDVNCSVRPEGQDALGVKTEIKNMNTFKGVHRALTYENQRQKDTLSKGGTIVQETRRWDDGAGVTVSMRTKEYAHDYRYFPDPDLMPVVITEEQSAEWKATLPELPAGRKLRMVEAYGIPEYDAGVLAAEKTIADYFEEAAKLSGNGKATSNWVMTEMMRALSETEQTIAEVKISPQALADLVKIVDEGVVNSSKAKEVFNEMVKNGGDPRKIVDEKGLGQVSDSGELDGFVEDVIAEHAQSAEDYKNGKDAALQHLMGQVMRKSKGKANPKLVIAAFQARLRG